MKKWIEDAFYFLGAVTWPWCAGVMWVEGNAMMAVAFLGWAVMAWWRMIRWLRR